MEGVEETVVEAMKESSFEGEANVSRNTATGERTSNCVEDEMFDHEMSRIR